MLNDQSRYLDFCIVEQRLGGAMPPALNVGQKSRVRLSAMPPCPHCGIAVKTCNVMRQYDPYTAGAPTLMNISRKLECSCGYVAQQVGTWPLPAGPDPLVRFITVAEWEPEQRRV